MAWASVLHGLRRGSREPRGSKYSDCRFCRRYAVVEARESLVDRNRYNAGNPGGLSVEARESLVDRNVLKAFQIIIYVVEARESLVDRNLRMVKVSR